MKKLVLFLIVPIFAFGNQCLTKNKNCIIEKSMDKQTSSNKLNLFLLPIKTCSKKPLTGFFRDGTCHSNERDQGNHSVCAKLSQEFLDFTKKKGNDLSTPNTKYQFPGLKPGDSWCLCASRWLEAKNYGIELEVNHEATSKRAITVSNKFDFSWKFRVIECSNDYIDTQQQILKENLPLSTNLKLVLIQGDQLKKKCRLIGLDGEIKFTSSHPFPLDFLEEKINSMPMRRSELSKK